jgi:hypothetical protein
MNLYDGLKISCDFLPRTQIEEEEEMPPPDHTNHSHQKKGKHNMTKESR